MDALIKYQSRLPTAPGIGNILLADAQARRLRYLWATDDDAIRGFDAQLKIFLEHHMGLRTFYPEIWKFYSAVQTGRIESPLHQDAVEGVMLSLRDNTPALFDPSITDALDGTVVPLRERTPFAPSDASPANGDRPMPPDDPLKELNPEKARNYTFGGIVNALWKVYLDGEKVTQAAEEWKNAGRVLQPHVEQILAWLRAFTGS
jgi:hypothetical protein